MLAIAAVAAPVLLHFNFPFAAVSLRLFFASVCHQDANRCFAVFAIPIAVCARCLGIYAGAVAGFLLKTERTTAVQALIGFAVINLVSALAELAGLTVGNRLRFCLGVGLGAAAANLLGSRPRITRIEAVESQFIGN
ncbi:MAG TPA: DUF2085 domain-containing protein [Terriglobales bacterium]|nr:DUF2085 domain-containing protein [Terriglobales bacterium]